MLQSLTIPPAIGGAKKDLRELQVFCGRKEQAIFAQRLPQARMSLPVSNGWSLRSGTVMFVAVW
jgi:hypothetical protein